MEYETARNLTLLFFLERLMERGEPRTLHDLSCQFGSKGFTKEMRQIAGGSQSGELFEHAQQFSFLLNNSISIVTIEFDNVNWPELMNVTINLDFIHETLNLFSINIRTTFTEHD